MPELSPESRERWAIRESMAQLRDDASARGYGDLAVMYSLSCVQLGTEILIEVAADEDRLQKHAEDLSDMVVRGYFGGWL